MTRSIGMVARFCLAAMLVFSLGGGAPTAAKAQQADHVGKNPITDPWPTLTAGEVKSVQDLLDQARSAKTAAGVREAREKALAKLVEVISKYCCNFNTMRGNAPVYDPAIDGEGTTQREKGGGVSIGTAAFSSVSWLYSSLKHEMVHSQQWQDPPHATAMGSDGREKEAYQREIDEADHTKLSLPERNEDQNRLNKY